MKNKFILAVVAALFVGLLGLPASARINDVGVLEGNAEMGKTFWSQDDCNKTGVATVVGRGLFLVGSLEDQGREAQGAWHLDTVATTVQHPDGIRLELCGWLGAVAGTEGLQWPGQPARMNGVGAACGASRGHSGMGEFGPFGAPVAKLLHVGWVTTATGALLLTGQYQEYVGGDRNSKGKKGTVLALLELVGGGGNCVVDPGNGAQDFNVVGGVKLVNQQVLGKPEPEECKETDPDQDKVKDTSGKRECPTAKKDPLPGQ